MKQLYIRPGALDSAGNPIGFKAEPGSAAAEALLAEGYRLESEQEAAEEPQDEEIGVYSKEYLLSLSHDELKALAKARKVRAYGILKEPALVDAILAAQQAETPDA